MTAFLIGAGLIFYGLLYSGVETLNGRPISTLDALRGRPAATTTGKAGAGAGSGSTTPAPRKGRV